MTYIQITKANLTSFN